MKRAQLLVTLLPIATLAACAHTPVDLSACNLPMQRLVLPEPAPTANAAGFTAPRPPATGYEAMVEAALAPPPPAPGGFATPMPITALFLSGGSQNGAFGAGFIDEWRVGGGDQLPAFRVVTGISTGALIGTTAFTGASDRAVAGYTINAESDLLDVKARGLISQVRAGAVGSLDPLRRRLDASLDDSLLTAIANADAQGRKFLVGVVDAREGEAYAIDMTALAARWKADPASRARTKQCYIEALVASSSVPFAAPPVYIDGRLLIDGGARFGVFAAAADSGVARASANATAAGTPAPVAFVIVNGKLEIEPQCRFDETTGPDGKKSCPAIGTLKKWNILELGFRSVDILTNQIYRFSAREAGAKANFVRINTDAPDHPYNGQTCSKWRAQDKAANPPPVQFHPLEMRCLIDYGRTRARTEKWWTKY